MSCRWQSRTNGRAIIVALLLVSPLRASLAQSTWERYKPGTLAAATSAADSMIRKSLIEVPGKGPSEHFLGDNPILATVVYKGDSRPINPIRHSLIAAWGKSFLRDSSIAADFHREYLFQEGDKLLWLPVQDTVATFFPKELHPGQRVSLFVMLIAGYYADGVITWAPIVNEFKAEPLTRSN
jgi:hypothetical protein